MSKFSATDSTLGYLYQIRTGLLWSLRRLRENKAFVVSIETLDDVVFESADGVATDLLQTKLHRNSAATLTNASVDLWKTLRIWIEGKGDGSIDRSAVLHLLTTARAPEGTIAYRLRARDRDESAAINAMDKVAKNSANKELLEAHRAFLGLDEDERKALVASIVVIDEAVNSSDLDDALRGEVRLSVEKQNLDMFIEHLEGWWFRRVIRQLIYRAPSDRISGDEIEQRIDELRDEWRVTHESPRLILPATGPSVSQLHFSARATAVVGRDDETRALANFVEASKKFGWWLMTGPGGAGKSRLALELCHSLPAHWLAGFLPRDGGVSWSQFRPKQPTLMIIDYVASRAAETSSMILQLGREAVHYSHSVRVLLLERDVSGWWRQFLREDSDSETAELASSRHDNPLKLPSLTVRNLYAIASQIAMRAQAAPPTAASFTRLMRTIDPLGRPLFAMIAGPILAESRADLSSYTPALRHIVQREIARWRMVLTDNEANQRFVNLVTLATLVGGLAPRFGGFDFLSDQTRAAHLLPNADLLDPDAYSALVGAPTASQSLPGLQPDILGERFVLDRLSSSSTQANTKRMLAAAWALQSADVCAFILRAAQDFLGDEGLEIALLAIPLENAASRAKWGHLISDVSLVAYRSDDPLTQKLMARLRELGREYTSEVDLQHALALAEFMIGSILLSERRLLEASTQYTRALEVAAPGSDIAAAAANNRGIIIQEIRGADEAFVEWTSVIEMPGIPDEHRACALNNRADVFAERGDHEAAIRDRSAVLALADTSHDRRYIALARRSQSHVSLGRHEDALADLDQIQLTEVISPHQKAEALLERGVLLRDKGRFAEAGRDFETVLESDDVFEGTHAMALVELAELARLESDVTRALDFIRSVEAAADATYPTLVQALVVTARVLEDQADVAGARGIWQSVLAHPHATSGQRRLAAQKMGSAEGA